MTLPTLPPNSSAFDWQDPLRFEDQLSPEERLLRDSTHAWCQENLMPRILEANRHAHFDQEILAEMGQMGFLGSPCLRNMVD
jgi:glutaryl-CoA dehydrogenase